MSILDQQLVNIAIVTSAGGIGSELRLEYRGQVYQFYQAFAMPKLDGSIMMAEEERIIQKCPQLVGKSAEQYLLVRETGYYSLWEIGLAAQKTSIEIYLQQASIWLFQELWLRLQDLMGVRQLQTLADSLLLATPAAQVWLDLDQLLMLDPLSSNRLNGWLEDDFREFDRQLYHLTQSKLGHKFITELATEILEAMPTELQLILANILNISVG